MSLPYQQMDEESQTGSEHSDTSSPSRVNYQSTNERAVTSVTTPSQIRLVNGEASDQVANVMTSRQALMKRKPANNSDQTDGWEDDAAEHIKNFECPAGDRYVQHESRYDHYRAIASRIIDHFVFRLLTIILIVIDLCIVIASLIMSETAADPTDPQLNKQLKALDYTALCFSSYFILEVSTRIFAQSPKVFFRQILEIVDVLVVLVSFIVVVVDLIIDEQSLEYANRSEELEYFKILTGLRLLRLIRFAMLIRVAITQRKHLAKASRLMVSENKRRFQKDGFDLDLCYITDRLIAMSFPSEGIMSVYRNPIEEVSRFFNTKHLGHYRIYNCCSERSYDADKYFHNSVIRIMIDDHNVPSLQEMIEFAHNVEDWMNEDRNNVIAIHCKGGKGRTGTMVCTWLLHSEAFSNAEDALDYFASRRTDLSVGSKYQGVETPSQSRYVKYFEIIKSQHAGKMPPIKRVKPTKISVSGLRGIGTEDGKDLSVKLIVKGEVIYEAKFGTNTNCTTLFERETFTITASLVNSPILAGDIKVRFEATSNIPCDYDDCPWYFWFNTSFITNNELSLGREELDNPHKQKAWKLYRPDFVVSMDFSDVV